MKIFFIIPFFISFSIQAGSFMRMLDEFPVTSEEEVKAVKPDFSVKSIRRGSDDGNFASTSDAGILTLQLQSIPKQEQGYIFEIVEGQFEDMLFSAKPVTPSEYIENRGKFTFIWLDGNNDEQEPFKIKVKIVGISKSGDKSSPQYLEVKHAGVKKPWWKLW